MIQGEILQNSWSGFGGIQDRFDSIPPPRLLMIGIYIEEYPREQLQTTYTFTIHKLIRQIASMCS
jgi:hypothetical protein